MLRTVLITVWVLIACSSLAAGLGYYVTPFDERPFSELHELFAPTGLVGQGHGVIGTLMIAVGVAMYSARKRWSALASMGNLQRWLDVHIFLCTLGAFLVILHTTFKAGGLVSISLWSMIIVLLSGFFGRYLYLWIPKTVQGRQRTAASVREERDRLIWDIVGSTSLTPSDLAIWSANGTANGTASGAGNGTANGAASGTTGVTAPGIHPGDLTPAAALLHSFRARRNQRATYRRLSDRLQDAGVDASTRSRVVSVARRHDKLGTQLRLLPSFQRLLRYWHAVHVPLTILMFAVLGIHVAVAIAFGYTWIF